MTATNKIKKDTFGTRWVGNYQSQRMAEALKTSATVLVAITEPGNRLRYYGYIISKDESKEFERWIKQKENVSEIIWMER